MAITRSPTIRLLAGLAITLTTVAVYSGYTLWQLHGLRRVQTETLDRDRTDSLLLLRVQNNLNSLALSMRDMLEPPSLIRSARGRASSSACKRPDRRLGARRNTIASQSGSAAIPDAFATQFWNAVDRIFIMAENGQEEEARAQDSSLARGASRGFEHRGGPSAGAEQRKRGTGRGADTRRFTPALSATAYLFLAAMMILSSGTGLYLVH